MSCERAEKPLRAESYFRLKEDSTLGGGIGKVVERLDLEAAVGYT